MRNMFWVISLMLLMSAVPALAQLDPDDDGIGVYFDPCACVQCLSLDVGEQLAFLVITHPTSPQGVGGWEAKVWLDGPAVITNFELLGNAINVATRANEYIVGEAYPLINPFTYPAVVVARIHFVMLDVASPVNFWIDGVYFHSLPYRAPAYLDGSDYDIIKELRQSTGGVEFPVATINGECAVAVDPATWDGVKALYR